MEDLFFCCPQPPSWKLDWDALDAAYPWIRRMRGCVQDSVNHAEGDVWTHVRMVCEALTEIAQWRSLPEEERHIVFAAALLHDVAKPETRKEELDGHVSFRGHSRRGAIVARQLFWRANLPFVVREQVANLIRYHQIPFYFIERDDNQKLALEMSQSVRCDHLSLLAEADARGRICQDQNRLLENIALFVESCRELGCLTEPYRFPSEHTRFLYFREAGRYPDGPAYQENGSMVVMMSGLPGSGKDHWIRTHLPDWPVVSLDQVRQDLDIDPTEAQGQVVQEARKRARVFLRSGQDFIWNATNLSRQVRQGSLKLFADYHATIRIVYREVPSETLFSQNRNREVVVPVKVIERMLDRWEVPDLTEAHCVEWVV